MRWMLLILVMLCLQSCFLFPKDADAQATRALLEARGEQADKAMKQQDYQVAVSLFEQILASQPDNVPALIGLGDAQGELGQWPQAEPAFAKAATLEPQSYDAQFGHGLSLQMLDRFIDAVAAYHRALVIDPLSGSAALGVGTSYLQLDEPQHALPFAHRAVELIPDDGRAWTCLGAALEQTGEHDQSLDAYLAASERMESSPEIKHNLLHAYARAGRHLEVVGTARSMLAESDNPQAAERMGWACFRLGQYEESADAYRQAVRMDPQMWRAWNGLGVTALNKWLLSDKGDAPAKREAAHAFMTSLRIHPDQNKVASLVERYQLGG